MVFGHSYSRMKDKMDMKFCHINNVNNLQPLESVTSKFGILNSDLNIHPSNLTSVVGRPSSVN